jgi:hypothetical protein
MASRPSPDFEALIALVSVQLREHRIPFMLIGGQAVLLHGEPRLTHDIDITLGVSPDRLPDLLLVCDAVGLDPLPEDVATFVQQTFVLPAAEESGIRVDFVFSTTPNEAQAIARAVIVMVKDEPVRSQAQRNPVHSRRGPGLEDAAGVGGRRQARLELPRALGGGVSQVPGREGMGGALRQLRSGVFNG